MGLKFKHIFPEWQKFRDFLIDYSIFYRIEDYPDAQVIIYYSILYRAYANSRVAFYKDEFLEQFSLTISEHFREFFKVRALLDLVNDTELKDLLTGVESITNVAENPNINTDKDSIVNYIGIQTKNVSRENIVDRVYNLVKKIRVNEVSYEIEKYKWLFMTIIPRIDYYYSNEEDE